MGGFTIGLIIRYSVFFRASATCLEIGNPQDLFWGLPAICDRRAKFRQIPAARQGS